MMMYFKSYLEDRRLGRVILAVVGVSYLVRKGLINLPTNLCRYIFKHYGS